MEMNRQEVRTDKALAPVGPYSQAVKFGNLVFTAGQIPLNPATGELVRGDIKQEAKQVLDNLARVLEAAGTETGRALKVTVFLTDMADFGAVNEVYGEYFSPPYPARSCVQVAALPLGVRVEVEAVAEC